MHAIRDRIRLASWHWPALGFITCAALVPTGAFEVLAPLPLAIVLLWLGAKLPIRIGARNDISYGMYIYAFPVQQLIFFTFGASLQPWWFALVSFAATVPFAWASWSGVERPAMRLRDWPRERRQPLLSPTPPSTRVESS